MKKLLLAMFLVILFPVSASAAAQAGVTIEQVSPTQVGVWTFLFGNGSSLSSATEGINALQHSFTVTDFEPMTFSVTQPAGMAAKISIYRNGDFMKTENIPQFSFTPYPNEKYRFVVQYSYSLLGSLGVTSDPSGVRFRMKGPTAKIYSATTPFTFKSLPAGKYSLLFASTRLCSQPAPHTAVVAAESRNTVNVSLICTTNKFESVDTSRVSKRTLVENAKSRETKPRGTRK